MRYLLLFLLAACNTTTREIVPVVSSNAEVATDAPLFVGRYWVMWQKTVCQSIGGVNPMVWTPLTEPRVGQQVVAEWTTRACQPFPADMAWMIVSYRPQSNPVDFLWFGMPGCWLMVNLDQIIPISTGTNSLFSRGVDSGEIYLDFIPPTDMAGRSMWLQLLVAAPGENTVGFLASAALQIDFGSR